MPFIAVRNKSRLDDADAAFFAAAVDAQLREDFIPRWNGVSYTPATFFSSDSNLPVASGIARLMIVADTLDVEGALGYHDFQGVPRSIVLAQGDRTSVTISHEAVEMTADPGADKWIRMPDGGHVALEVADPVEGDSYAKAVTIMKRTRDVQVSNFVFPNWFQPDSVGPWDFMGTTPGPLQCAPGGYMVVQDADGQVRDVWAEFGSHVTLASRMRKVLNSTSRTYRRGVRL